MEKKIMMTPEQREVIAWLRGGDVTPNEMMEGRFIEMVMSIVYERLGIEPYDKAGAERALERQLRRQRARERGNPLSIKTILKEVAQENPSVAQISATTPSIEQNAELQCSNLDSVNLARCLLYMASLEGLSLNNSQVQVILYIAYGVWMSEKGLRLTIEHPQMWQFGPVFPRAYNRIKKGIGDCAESYESIKRDSPDVYNLLVNCFRRFARTTASVLTAPHTADGTPWATKRKECPDKWGVPMDDKLIGKWFSQMNS